MDHFSALNYLVIAATEGGNTMGSCQCGFSTDPEKNCNGTHNLVKAVKADIAQKLEVNGFEDAAAYIKTN